MTLIGITFHGNRPTGFTAQSYVDLRTPNHNLIGWRIHVRGVKVFFVSPRGWRPGLGKEQWKKSDPSEIFEVPRSSLSLHWEGDGEALDVDKTTWPVEAGKK